MGRPWLRNIDLKRRCPVEATEARPVVKTPLRPGRVNPFGLGDPDGKLVLTVAPDTGRGDAAWRERAEWVARAVNCHEELVQLAVECEDFVSVWHSARDGGSPYPGGLLERLRKVLARAKSQ
jgi:hypothetical protein